MLYCDKCGKEKRLPRVMVKSMKSYGACEICKKTNECNDISPKLQSLGDVDIFTTAEKNLMSKRNNSFRAEKGEFRIIAYESKRIWGNKKMLFVPAFLVKDYKDIEEARKSLQKLRKGFEKKKDTENYISFLYNCKGEMQKASA